MKAKENKSSKSLIPVKIIRLQGREQLHSWSCRQGRSQEFQSTTNSKEYKELSGRKMRKRKPLVQQFPLLTKIESLEEGWGEKSVQLEFL